MKIDTLFINAKIYNVFLKEWGITDIAILGGKILYTGNSESISFTADSTIDCKEKPLIPGLIDIHLHIESSLCTPSVFADTVLPHGVTTVVSEPHEIANVYGLSGIEEMIRVSEGAVVDIFYSVPSSVPSTNSKLETTGGTINHNDLKILMRKYSKVICLGEVMNYSTLINNFSKIVSGEITSKTIELINQTMSNHPLAAIEGHCPSVKNLDLAKLLYFGIDSDHCLQDIEGMKQRFANGMFVELQEKSVIPEIINYLQSNNVEGLYSFVTDDVPPDILEEKGHLDYVVRKALGYGLSLENAIIATSLAPAKRMGFRDRGIIAPGKIADFILLEDLSSNFNIVSVFKRGLLVKPKKENKSGHKFSPDFLDSINLPAPAVSNSLFILNADKKFIRKNMIKCRIMRKNSKNTYTESVFRYLPVLNGRINWLHPDADVNLVLVIERYSGKGTSAQGLIDGVRLHNGAYCTSHSHDHHNILLVGDNIEDMTKALDWVIQQKGGMCTASRGHILASVSLPVGGILSEAPMKELSENVQSVQKTLRQLGITHINPIMSMSTLSLPVSPELKITDKGLIDVRESKIVSLLVE